MSRHAARPHGARHRRQPRHRRRRPAGSPPREGWAVAVNYAKRPRRGRRRRRRDRRGRRRGARLPGRRRQRRRGARDVRGDRRRAAAARRPRQQRRRRRRRRARRRDERRAAAAHVRDQRLRQLLLRARGDPAHDDAAAAARHAARMPAARSSTSRRRPPSSAARASTSTTPPRRAASRPSRSAWPRKLAGEGIRVNAVRPGIIDTDIHASGGTPDRVRQIAPQLPMQRAGTADEVGEAIVWLLSEQVELHDRIGRRGHRRALRRTPRQSADQRRERVEQGLRRALLGRRGRCLVRLEREAGLAVHRVPHRARRHARLQVAEIGDQAADLGGELLRRRPRRARAARSARPPTRSPAARSRRARATPARRACGRPRAPPDGARGTPVAARR